MDLEVYLADLKTRTNSLRRLLASVDAERSQKREEAELADITEDWLLAVRERVEEEFEGDPEEASRARRRLVKLLVQSIAAGKRPDDGRTEIQIAYRFGPPPTSGVSADQSSVDPFKNGSRS